MGLCDLEIGKLTVPLYEMGAFATVFYVGYNEGKGIDMGPFIGKLMKYGPTSFAMALTPSITKAIYILKKTVHKQISEELQDGSLEVRLKDGSKKEYGELNEEEKKDITPKIIDGIKTLESGLNKPNYLKETLDAGSRTAFVTFAAYVAGRLYSQMG